MTNRINSRDRTYNWQLQPYVSWKGNNYNQASLINSRPETNGSWILSKQPEIIIISNIDINSSQTIEIKSGNPLYDQYTLIYSGSQTTFRLPYTSQGDTTLINKMIIFKITGSTSVALRALPVPLGFPTIIIDGFGYAGIPYITSSSFILRGTGAIGNYITEPYKEYPNDVSLKDGNAFLPRPIKHWRKQLSANPIRGGTENIRIAEIDRPGLYNMLNNNACCDISKNSISIISNIQEKNNSNIYDNSETTITYADVSNCWNDPIGKRICCNPEANIITYKTTPLERNYISYSYYFKNRCYTYNQNISTTKVKGNTYFTPSGIATYPIEFPNGCQVLHKKECSSDCCRCYCGTSGRVQDMIYKPNNRQFAKHGATSSKSRINALKANTIDQGGALFNNANGLKQVNNGICGLNGDSLYYVKTKPTQRIQTKCGPAYVPLPPPPITFFVASGLQFTREGNGIAYNGIDRWVAVGGGSYSMLYSNDGITWFETLGSKFPTNFGGTDVAYANNIWVAVGSGGSNTILHSYDGITWFTSNGVLFTNSGTSIAYGNNKWIALGYDTAPELNTILQSNDGINWTIVTGAKFTNGIGLQVKYNNRWVAVGRGDNTILYSDDGNTWNVVSSFPIGVRFSIVGNSINYDSINNRWVAVGEGTYTILYSDDGISWTASPNSFSLKGSSVYYDGYSRWVAVGQRTEPILTSIDGVNWNVVNGPKFSIGGSDLMYADNRWVAVGTDNSILTSFDGINWELANGTLFSLGGFGKYILYGNRWVALGYGTFGRPTILYSN